MATCELTECEHDTWLGYPTCACHLPAEVYQAMAPDDLLQAITVAALESDEFVVNEEGEISLKEGES